MADNFYGAAKQKFVEGLKEKIFGQGLLGKSLRAGYEAKFGTKKEKNNDSENIQKQNVSILRRINIVVTNISDNIYNIAGVLNAQLTSMKETEEEMRRQELEKLVASEEQSIESKTSIIPKTNQKPKAEKKDNIFNNLNESFSSFKNSILKFSKGLSSLLKSKKFLALASVAALGGAAAYSTAKDKEPEKNISEESIKQITSVSSPDVTLQVPESGKENPATTNLPQNNLTLDKKTSDLQSVATKKPSLTPNIKENDNFSAPTINNDLESQATTPNQYFSNVIKINEQKQAEKNATIKKLRLENKYAGEIPENSPELLEIEKKYQEPLINAISPKTTELQAKQVKISKETTNSFKNFILQKTNLLNNVQTSDVQPTDKPEIVVPNISGSFSIGSSTPSSDVNNAKQIPSFPSTGSMINETSSNVEALSDNFAPPVISNVNNSSLNSIDTSEKPRMKIPTPVANRGSLDNYSFFHG